MGANTICLAWNKTEFDSTAIKNNRSDVFQMINAPTQCSGFETASYDDDVIIKFSSGSYFALHHATS